MGSAAWGRVPGGRGEGHVGATREVRQDVYGATFILRQYREVVGVALQRGNALALMVQRAVTVGEYREPRVTVYFSLRCERWTVTSPISSAAGRWPSVLCEPR